MLQIKGSDWGKVHGFFAEIKAFPFGQGWGEIHTGPIGDMRAEIISMFSFLLEPPCGVEPQTSSLRVRCSTN